MHFESPWNLLLLLTIPLLLWLRARRKRTGGLRFPSVGHAADSGRSLRQRLGAVPLLLQSLALVLIVIALARPQKGLERVREVSKGVAIEMVVDRSGSMGTEMEYGGERLNRLGVVKRVFEKFVLGDGHHLKGRPDDLIGMVVFARYADTICPLTLAHGALPRFLENVHLVQRRAEDGTAIGDAIALAAARLKTAEGTLRAQRAKLKKDYTIKSKVIILLTDGENNAGERSPVQAARLAADWGIKIYTIGVGGGEAVTTVQTLFGAFKIPMGPGVDESTLRAVADASGGRYWRADDAKSLEKVYQQIDKLERSEIEAVRYVDYKELFTPFAFTGLLLLLAQVGLSGTVFRKIP
jgi:Ca-activated chloride channel family protein